MAESKTVDLLIIGGGINGAGIARDAAGRGLSVILCEQGDLASATSSASSKLIHGGLRYLEHYAFRFVRRALLEREVLLGIAPHIVSPMRFVLPHDKSLRPTWLISLGLKLYDQLGRGHRLPRSRRINLRDSKEGAPLENSYAVGFTYFDCFVDDARLVVLNACDARDRGADIRTKTRFMAATRDRTLWRAELVNLRDGTLQPVSARALVNAAGPWVGAVRAVAGASDHGKKPRLVKGSHIILPRLYQGDHAYILQNDDRRVVFVIPYEQNFSLVGTTEIPFETDPSMVAVSPAEEAYLCRAVSRYFREPITPAEVVHGFSGVRPLFDDKAASASAVTREYVLDLDASDKSAPLLSIFGGKITTYRRLAEQAVEALAAYMTPPRRDAWTTRVPLPGGEFEGGDFDEFLRRVRAKYAWLPATTTARLAHAYGTRLALILGDARSPSDLGKDFGAGLTQAEIDYLMTEEWAETGEDILWRRSKLGLHMSEEERACVDAYVRERLGAGTRRG